LSNSARFKAWALNNGARFKAWALRNDVMIKAWALNKVSGSKPGLLIRYQVQILIEVVQEVAPLVRNHL